ncbi:MULTISPECIES: leucine zipper domain-containing protein [unclassified Synechococcus]|uniref:helix-turn-helix domain-containing protein n=1 Tax=Synechococcales TaxID=1890424 RepID=UPI001628B3B5
MLRLTPIGRERLIRQHLDEGRSLAQLAADHGFSERTARKWWSRQQWGSPDSVDPDQGFTGVSVEVAMNLCSQSIGLR